MWHDVCWFLGACGPLSGESGYVLATGHFLAKAATFCDGHFLAKAVTLYEIIAKDGVYLSVVVRDFFGCHTRWFGGSDLAYQ